MEVELCFICGVKIGRGNRSEVGSQEKMDKLVSVSSTVQHSSTIISDILSRILSRTVMREESVCRICFNLLNDIDYHLKEAQEKTDEITNKFLDKEKDPLQYQPSNLADSLPQAAASRRKQRIFGKLVTTSGGRPGVRSTRRYDPNEVVSGEEADQEYVHIGSVPLSGTMKGVGGSGKEVGYSTRLPSSRRNAATESIQLVPVHPPPRTAAAAKHRRNPSPSPQLPAPDSEVGASSADELTVSELAEKKRRLISKVLAPNKRMRHEVREEETLLDGYDEELTIDTGRDRFEAAAEDRDLDRARRKKEKKRKKKEKERRLREMEKERRERDELRRQGIIGLISDDSDQEEAKENTSPKKTKDIRTVDLAQLGDLFSNAPEKDEDLEQEQIVARKSSVPTPAARKQMDFAAGQAFYILPHNFTTREENGDLIEHMTLEPTGDVVQGAHTAHTVLIKQNISTGAINLQEMSDASDNEVSSPYKDATVVTRATDQVHTVAVNQSQQQQQLHTVITKIPTNVQVEARTGAPASSTGNKPNVACPHCDKKFMRGYNMRVHIDRVHNKNKPWQCQFCEKSFATTSDLKQHMSTHGMGKIHKCADCGRQFNNRDSAILHRKQHNNERTHVCQECGKGFFKASCLSRHMRCHTGEKPFPCEFCGRKFSQITTLKHHKKVCKFTPADFHGSSTEIKISPEQRIEVNPQRKLNISL